MAESLRSLSNVNVLLVSGDPDAERAIGEMLRATWSCAVLISHPEWDADGARKLLEHAVDCVVLDLSTAAADPLDALERMRTAAPDVPIVVLSEQHDDELELRAVKAGAQDYLIKTELQPALLGHTLSYAIERKRSEVELAHQALHDPLTRVPNRALFLDRLGVALERARRSRAQLAVLFLDVDNFKRINDTRGHAAGDRLLAGLAGRLVTMLRPMDTVARFGGDEFTFLFEDLTSEREVVLIAERISRAAGEPLMLDGSETSITVSIGIAMVTDPTAQPEAVIREADAAMYRAKERGRARYELFDETARQRAMERLELEAALKHAVERCELRVHYQPRVSLSDQRELAGLEALVRWEHPERGLMAPSEFIPLAEDTGLMLPIGQYVLERAVTQLAGWRRHKPDMTISVNMSSRELENTNLVSTLNSAITATELEPSAVCLEITEGAVAHDAEAVTTALERLRAIGVQIAIDDFGTGSSSWARLKRLPADALKIHQSFVTGVGENPQDASIVAAMIELGHALGLKVVAEGVETHAQLDQLRALGCDSAQGYLVGRPVPADEIQRLLVEQLA